MNQPQRNNKHKSAVFIMRKLFAYLWIPEASMRLRVFVALVFLIATIYLNIRVPFIFKDIVDMLSSCSIIVGIKKIKSSIKISGNAR